MVNGPDCAGCPLQPIGTGFVREDGEGRSGVLVVAEALGELEAEKSHILIGPAGQHWRRILRRTQHPTEARSLEFDDFRHANVISCRPPNNFLSGAPWEEGALAHCKGYLEELIRRFKPKAILGLGNTPLRFFTGETGIEKLRGYVFDTPYGIPFIGSYHPSHLIRSGKNENGAKGKVFLSPIVQFDVLTALKVAREGLQRPVKRYITHPSPMEAAAFRDAWRAAGRPSLATDIETPHVNRGGKEKDDDSIIQELNIEDDPSYSCIYRISFAFERDSAISMPWMPPYTSVAREMLAEATVLVGWNVEDFDIPRLAHHGAPLSPTVQVIDAMKAWHHLKPSLPAGLKVVANLYQHGIEPWKLKSISDPEWYSASDSDFALICWTGIKADFQRAGRWENYSRHVLQLVGPLRKMRRIGVRTDEVLRAEKKQEFTEEYNAKIAELQTKVPEVLLPRKIYKISKERILKKGVPEEKLFVAAWEEVELKPGWRVTPEGDLEKIPKVKKERKPRGKRTSDEGCESPRPRKRRVRTQGGVQIPPVPQEGEHPAIGDLAAAKPAA